MERWARSLPHKQWWQRFVRDTGGTGFWHETYLMRGGMEASYEETPRTCHRGDVRLAGPVGP
jgi:hypothetical protein